MVLKKDARAVLQFYPETSEQAVVIAQAASKVTQNNTSHASFALKSLLFFAAILTITDHHYCVLCASVRLVLRAVW